MFSFYSLFNVAGFEKEHIQYVSLFHHITP